MKVISYNTRILNPQEHKLSTLDRELLGIVHGLQIYEFLIIGSPHPIHVYTNHKHLLHWFTKKGNLTPRFYRAQIQLTKFSILKIIHTPGKNLSVADMLSRSFTKAELQLNQLKHKQLPPQIDFALLQNGTLKPVHYMKKSYLTKNMTLTQFSLIMVQINSLYVSMTKKKTLLSSLYNRFHLKL